MPTYFVKTQAFFDGVTSSITRTVSGRNLSRTLVIEADEFRINPAALTYDFYKSNPVAKKAAILVASVPQRDVFAVLNDEFYQNDYFYTPQNFEDLEDLEDEDDDEDDHDDTCLDCRLEEFVNSDAFFDEVYNIIDFYLSPTNEPEVLPSSVPYTAAGETRSYLGIPIEPRTDVPAGPSTTVPDAQNYPIEHWRTTDGEDWWGFQTTLGFVHFTSEESAGWGRETHLTHPGTKWDYKDLTGATRLED